MRPTALDRASAEEARRWEEAAWALSIGGSSLRRWTWSPVAQMKRRLRERRGRFCPLRPLEDRPGNRWRMASIAACLYCHPYPRDCPVHGIPF